MIILLCLDLNLKDDLLSSRSDKETPQHIILKPEGARKLLRASLIWFTLDGKILRSFQHVIWAGSGLVIVSGNNIYHQPDKSSPMAQQLTRTGSDQLTNGITQGMYRGGIKQRKI